MKSDIGKKKIQVFQVKNIKGNISLMKMSSLQVLQETTGM